VPFSEMIFSASCLVLAVTYLVLAVSRLTDMRYLLLGQVLGLMQGVRALDAHIPTIVVDVACVCPGVHLRVLGVQDRFVAEASANLK
jgi:hypothetical protein